MLSFPHTVRIFLHTEAVDLRKSFDGLSGLVSQAIPEEDLLSGHLFLFLNGRRDRIKMIYWDADGLVIWYKGQKYRYCTWHLHEEFTIKISDRGRLHDQHFEVAHHSNNGGRSANHICL
ncbi:MAG: IS66 family insertion sequence element accessory protein TnpB [Isosphaeraceae bacterium]|nr:IS66 family insertion sequence element accessory protein TnpB [Isosphaeraceae bacterium]